MSSLSGNETRATAFPRWSAGRRLHADGLAAEAPAGERLLLPRPDESVEEYADRLRELHQQVAALIEAVERGLVERAADRPRTTLAGARATAVVDPAGAASSEQRRGLDATAVFWTVNVLCWIAVTTIVLVWGLAT